jgi:hypothetical protein
MLKEYLIIGFYIKCGALGAFGFSVLPKVFFISRFLWHTGFGQERQTP